MKRRFFYALGAVVVSGVMLVSCNKTAGSKVSLNNSLDSLSYAYGVNLADQGLVQFLEQSGVMQNTTMLDYEYQARMATMTDSAMIQKLEKELKHKKDSLNKLNGPKLNDFIRGLKEVMNKDPKESAYIKGLSLGTQMVEQMIPQLNSDLAALDSTQKVNNDQFLAGIISVLKNSEMPISRAEAGAFVQKEMNKMQEAQMKKHEEEMRLQYKDSIAAGEAFMMENAKRPEVVTLPSGLQYEIIKKGNGEIPTAESRVKVRYHGTLLNGTVFDSNMEEEPVTFNVNQVIKGWQEGLQLMPVGSKWKFYIPYQLAYGAQSMGAIHPFSNLIFDVEMVGIEK